MAWLVVFTSATPKPDCRRTPRSAEFLDRCDAVIFHGVDCQVFQPPADRQAALAEVGLAGKQVIASFGRIRPSKGTDLFVEALIQLLPRHSGWMGVVTGLCQRRDQPFLDSLRHRILAAGLEQRIWFVGDLESAEIRRWYQRASICVAASRREGFGLTPLEAMASGCVPVTSTAGAWPWIIQQDFGCAIEMGQPAPLFACLDALVGDAVRIDQMASAARSRAVAAHSIQREVDCIHQLYDQLVLLN